MLQLYGGFIWYDVNDEPVAVSECTYDQVTPTSRCTNIHSLTHTNAQTAQGIMTYGESIRFEDPVRESEAASSVRSTDLMRQFSDRWVSCPRIPIFKKPLKQPSPRKLITFNQPGQALTIRRHGHITDADTVTHTFLLRHRRTRLGR